MTQAQELIARATDALRKGDRLTALGLVRQALSSEPRNHQALFYSGILELEDGNINVGVDQARLAVEASPQNALYQGAFARALRIAGRLDEALLAANKALSIKPDLEDALLDLGIIHKLNVRNVEAEAAFRRLVKIAPRRPDAHNLLGRTLRLLGRFDEAEASYQQSIALWPTYVDPVINLGLLYSDLRQYELAAKTFSQALNLDPNSYLALNNLGTVYSALNRDEDALACYRTATRLQPQLSLAHANVGTSLRKLGNLEEAIASYTCALELDERETSAIVGLGIVADIRGQFDVAVDYFKRALSVDPNSAEAHTNLGLLLLRHKVLADGWNHYAWRWKTKKIGPLQRKFPQPEWDGRKLDHGTLLIWAEQGVGDEVFYSGWVRELASSGYPILFECEPRLVPIFRRSLPGVAVVARTTPAAPECKGTNVAAQTALAALGPLLRPSAQSIVAPQSVLRPDPDRRDRALRSIDRMWPQRDGPLIGISWKSPLADFGREKTFSIRDWRQILTTKGIRWLDLQYGATEKERSEARDELGIEIRPMDGLDPLTDLDGLAAAASVCDLVISVSNTTAHIAAAVGAPTWILAPKGNGRLWYWFTESGPSPWYENVTVFHQSKPGDWTQPLKAVADRLRTFLKSHGSKVR